MQETEIKIQVNADRTVEVELPDSVPVGEYKAMLVPAKKLSARSKQVSNIAEDRPWDEKTDAFWEEWIEEVEQMPLSPQSAQSEYHESLLEKYCKQRLEL